MNIKSIGKKLSEYYPMIFAPLMVAALVLTTFYLCGQYPFGEGTIAWCDMNQQTVPLLMDLKDIMAGRDGLLFNMHNAGGMNFLGVFFFFLSSPFSLLVAFVKKQDVLLFVDILFLLKLMLSSVTSAYYFQKYKKVSRGVCVSLAVMYALSGYGLMYYQNLMWLDIVYMFPLLVCGLENILKKQNNILYTVSLTLIVFMNFYIAVMVVIFILIYYLVFISSDKKSRSKNTAVSFFSGSLIAALCSAVVWLTSFFGVSSSSRLGGSLDKIAESGTLTSYNTMLPMLFCTALIFVGAAFFITSKKNTMKLKDGFFVVLGVMLIPFLIDPISKAWKLSERFPNPAIYSLMPMFDSLMGLTEMICSLLIIGFVIFYVLFGKIGFDRKSSDLLIFALMLVPFVIEPINKMWHTGEYMSFPGRYGFMTIFCGLMCAADLLSENRAYHSRLKTPQHLGVAIGLFALGGVYAFIALKYTLDNFKTLTRYTASLWGSKESFAGIAVLFSLSVFVYAALLLCYKKKYITRSVFSLLLLMVCATECFVNLQIYAASPYKNNKPRTDDYMAVTNLCNKIEDDSFYRVRSSQSTIDYNMIGALGYNSISHYTSLTDKNYMNTQNLLGYSSVWMKAGNHGGTSFTDALYSIKYTVSTKRSKESVYKDNKYAINKTDLYFDLGIPVTGSVPEELPENLSRAQIQQYLYDSLFDGQKNLVSEYQYSNIRSKGISRSKGGYKINNGASVYYSFYVSGTKSLYFDCFDGFSTALNEDIYKSVSIKVNSVTRRTEFPTQNENGFLYLGDYTDRNVTVQIECSKDITCSSFGVFGMDKLQLKKNVKETKCASLNAQRGVIQGSCKMDDDGCCVLFVPYNDGMYARVNGALTRPKKVLGGFTAIELKKGDNSIEMFTVPKGLVLGVILSCLGIIALVIYIKFGKHLRIGKKLNSVCEFIVSFGSLAVLIVVYLLPLVLNLIHKGIG